MGWEVVAFTLTYIIVVATPCLKQMKTVIYFLNVMGNTSHKKTCFLSGIAQMTSPPGNLVLFFGRQKQRFARMTVKNINYDNDGCNDNYGGNFDDNDDKNYQF